MGVDSNAWGEAAVLGTFVGGVPGPIILSGNLVLAAFNADVARGLPARTAIFARNQGGKDRWGEAFRTTLGFRALSGDTAFLPGAAAGTLDVYVADTDRDGVRDGIDACPRDPLNNVEGGCTRNSAAYLVLDDLITLGDVATETRGDEFHITATFTNTSDTAIGNPFFEVTELTGGNVLVNADAGPGGPGATLSPDVGDGILSPGEPRR